MKKPLRPARLELHRETLRALTSPGLRQIRGGEDLGSGSFTETGTGLCVTHAQYSCVSLTAAC